MALTRLDNLISSKTGKYLYVSPDDFNASDELNNRGNSPIRPFKSIQRAFIEIARYSYLPGRDNDRYDQFTIMLMPGKHYIDNRPGLLDSSGIDAFQFDQALSEWTDSSSLDISDPNNILYKFNNTEGGAIIPRGSSLVGYDLRRTTVHPLYVPDPADMLEKRSAIFNVTGGCYFWQFTIRDGDLEPSSPLYDTNDGIGKVYNQTPPAGSPGTAWTQLEIPNFSHHKLTVFEYAAKEELGIYYQKVAKAFSQYQPTIDDAGEFGDRIQETRIVGPLSDLRSIESIKCTDLTGLNAGQIEVEVTTKVQHGYFKSQFIAIENNGLDEELNGTFSINEISDSDLRVFTYRISGTVAALGSTTNLVSGVSYSAANGLDGNAVVKAEVDSVESASPYVFNCSIRSTWGICGIWANGLKATGFKSMVIAQYTGVSLQKDDRAFIRYDEYTNTFNQASLTDAFATVPYHTKGDAFWKDDWRNFHVRASDDSFIQCVSIFAVGFADHFLMESGGDMSITNSNSNFGNTSLHAIGHKGYAFNQDKGGYITDIIPPQVVSTSSGDIKKNAYYTLDVQASNDVGNHTKLYIGDDLAYDPKKRPAATIEGYRIGAKLDDEIKVKLQPNDTGYNEYSSTLTPTGFDKFTVSAEVLNPSGYTPNNANLDTANRIEANKEFIAYEAYGYILGKYPNLKINDNIEIVKCRRDIGYLLGATIQDLRLGGNINTIQAAESYYVQTQGTSELSYITGELTETLEAYDYARDLAIAASRNFVYLRQGCETVATSSLVNVGDTSGIVQGMTVADYDPTQFPNGQLQANATRPNSPVIPDNTFVKRVVDSATIELGVKNLTGEKKVFSNRHGDAANLIEANRAFIAAEAFDRMSIDFPGYTSPTGYTSQDCLDDISDALKAIEQNVAFGGNAETWDAAYHYDSGAVAYLDAKKDETIRCFEYAKDMAIQVMRKEDVFVFGSHGLTQVKTTAQLNSSNTAIADASDPITNVAPDPVNDKAGDARNLILANADLIAHESVERMLLQSSTEKFTPTAAAYNPASGDLTLTINSHGLTGATTLSASDADYTASTGVLTITSNGHSMVEGERVHITDGSLTFTCGMDSNTTTHAYPRATDPVSGKWLEISNVTTNTFDVHVGDSPIVSFTPTDADYNPTTGVMELTVGAHGLTAGTNIKIAQDSLIFTCDQDSNATNHTYPRATDPIINGVAIQSVTANTITVQVLASAPSTNVTNHTFVSSSANSVVTGGDYVHQFSTATASGIKRENDAIRIDYNALTFTCGMDGNGSQHTYPRVSDPAGGALLAIGDTTANTVTVNVGKSVEKTYDVGDATYNHTTGDLTLSISNHKLLKGQSIRLADNSITFTCGQDANATNHSYPRSTDPAYQTALPITSVGSSNHTATGATYEPSNGVLELTVANHGFTNGDRIKISEGSLTFTCLFDNNLTEHAYPRLSDPKNDKWLTVSDATVNTFKVNVDAAGADQQYTPTDAAYDPATGDLTLTIGSHALSQGDGITIDNDSLSFTCTMDGNQVAQTYPRAGKDQASGRSLPIKSITGTSVTVDVGVAGYDKYFQPTAGTYNAATGEMVLTVGQHGLAVGSDITLKDNSLTFSCDKDGNATNHSYPRPGTDPYAGKSIAVTAVGSTSHTATGAVYTPTTGALLLSIANHGFSNGDYIQIADDSLTFTCELDGDTAQKSYPRTGFDYPSGRWLKISNVVANAFEVNVGISSDTSNHSFVSATASGITRQDGTFTINVGFDADANNQYAHTFVSALADAVEYEPQSLHTFVSAGANSVKHLPQSAHTFKRGATGGILKQGGTITVNVNVGASGQQYPHTFVSATSGAVISGGQYPHTFVSAVTDSIHKIFYVGGTNPASKIYHSKDCVDDVVDVLKAVADNVAYGGNDKTWDAAYSYKTGNHVVGEESETNVVFDYAKELAALVSRNQKILTIGSHGLTQSIDSQITTDFAQTADNKGGDAYNLIQSNKEFIAEEAYERMILNNAGFLPPTGNPQDCIDDIADFVNEVSYNVGFGGNDRTWDMANLYVTGAHVAGEEEQTLAAFKDATEIMIQVMRNEKVLVIGSHGGTQTYDNSITSYVANPINNKVADARDLIISNKNFVAEIALGRMIAQYPSYTWQTGYSSTDCLDDLKDVVDVVAHNLAYGGNDRVWDAANMYVAGAHAAGSENETIYAFNQVRDLIRQVMTNEAVTVGGHTSLAQATDTSITDGVTNGDCDVPKATVTSLVQILTNTISTPSSLLSVTRTGATYKCPTVESAINTLSDIVTNAISTPESLAPIARVRSAGKCEDVRNSIDTLFTIIQNTITTPTSLNSITRSSSNGSCQNVASTISTLFGILTTTINDVTSANPTGYLNSIERKTSPEGISFGASVNPNTTTTNSYLWFTLPEGIYADPTLFTPSTDTSITIDAGYPQCNSQSDAVRQFFANIKTIIQNGLNSVPRAQAASVGALSNRATLWKIAGTNPHGLETGTAVRLVPRPKAGFDVDKRKVRLPNGFETNEKYYIIASGRNTLPENYSGVSQFDGSENSQVYFMLASSIENAAAGIYLHSAEVEAIDPYVEIDVYQFILDDKYDLHQYGCKMDGTVPSGIRTDIPHIFDVPHSNTGSPAKPPTAHKVFFREDTDNSKKLPSVSGTYAFDPAVTFQSGSKQGKIRDDKFFYVRYDNSKVFTVYKTAELAVQGQITIDFAPDSGGTYGFFVFADKRQSPMRFDPSFDNPNITEMGKWYLNVKPNSDGANTNTSMEILARLHTQAYNQNSGQDKTNDTWFERITDDREADERIYRFRYVIPKYLKSVRDPLNGFTIKVRKDETRKLLPQKIVLKPITGTAVAQFSNPNQSNEKIGSTQADFDDPTNNINEDNQYDPYRKVLDSDPVGSTFTKRIATTNYIGMTVQSGNYFTEQSSGDTLLELTVFDPSIDNAALANEKLTTVKITAPEGGSTATGFTFSKDIKQDDNTQPTFNKVVWNAPHATGYAYIHAVCEVPGTPSEWHLILKGVVNTTGKLLFSESDNIRFEQGTVYADLKSDPDGGKSLDTKDLIAKNLPQYYYKQLAASVYTLTPGDIIPDDTGNQYRIVSVEDVGEIDDTFYIFNVQEIKKRIFEQQEGVYYITAVRGNHSPFPTGAGNQGNFRNFKFSQPISKLYPLNYKNDPLWYQHPKLEPAAIDPPATYSAADNYVHGLVKVNDFKGSMTKEAVVDFTNTSALVNYSYTGTNALKAQTGNASSGSEDRLIPITGDNTVLSRQKLYVELRRPSIARAGNHTFEYLGFGPGNYSTGLPARQEVVLTTTQDFYAQSKKQDGGLVFYTGLNSNGDLYIGNRKIDAITGEEVFLERAALVDSEDDGEDLGSLVTTFDTPVTFNKNITVNGGDDQNMVNRFNSPVEVNVLGTIGKDALIIQSNVSTNAADNEDQSLDRTAQFLNGETKGDVVISKNRVAASIFQFNPRGSNGAAQGYRIQNHVVGLLGSNVTPNQTALVVNGGSALYPEQNVSYSFAGAPLTGDMLLKGEEVGKSGSLGWIYANYYADVANASVYSLQPESTSVPSRKIRIYWNGLTNQSIGLTSGSQIRINGMLDSAFNDTFNILPGSFDKTNTWVEFNLDIGNERTDISGDVVRLWSTEVSLNNPSLLMEYSNSSWKEFGVIGAEAIRANVDYLGEYKLGINTVARAEHQSAKNAWTELATEPRANLDVVGTAFISGKTFDNTNWLTNSVLGNRTESSVDNAFLVGGDSRPGVDANNVPLQDNEATLRVSTTNGGRVGINVTNGQLNGTADTRFNTALAVDGSGYISQNLRVENDLAVNGGGGGNIANLTTTIDTGTFEFVNDTTFKGIAATSSVAGTNGLKMAGYLHNIEIGNATTDIQDIKIGNTSESSTITIADTVDGTIASGASAGTNVSLVTIGGAYNSVESASETRIGTKSFKIDGDVWLGWRRTPTDLSQTVDFKSKATVVNFLSNSGGPSTVNLATKASEINIAGQGGTTTVNNSFEVKASAKFNSNVELCGGNSSGYYLGNRGQLGTSITNHVNGLTADPENPDKNVDLVNVLVTGPNDPGYNQINTAGYNYWGSVYFRLAKTQVGGIPEVAPQTLPEIPESENCFYLPLLNRCDDYYAVGDYILINSPIVTGGHPEIVEVVELTRASIAPFWIKVRRNPLGDFAADVNSHLDFTVLYKCEIQFNSTWITQDLDNTGPQDDVYLAEFGGALDTADYIIVGRDALGTLGEFIKIAEIKDEVAQVFTINDCNDPDPKTVFEVNSVTGDTYVGGKLTIDNSVSLNGGCGSTVRTFGTNATSSFIGDIIAETGTVNATGISGIDTDDIAKLQIGDIVKLTSYNKDQVPILPVNTRITEIDDTSITLSNGIGALSAINNSSFSASKNEEVTITNGSNQNSLYLDTCTATLEIGNQHRRIQVTRCLPDIQDAADTETAYRSVKEHIRAYSYWLDPKVLQSNGPITALSANATTGTVPGSVYLPVSQLGVSDGLFLVGDLVIVGDAQDIANRGLNASGEQIFEIMKIEGVDEVNKVLRCSPAQEGTTALALSNYTAGSGNTTVMRILKHPESSAVYDIQSRSRSMSGVDVPYVSLILEKGYIVQTKLDYANWVRFHDTRTTGTFDDAFFYVGDDINSTVNKGCLFGTVHQDVMNEFTHAGVVPHQTGDLTVNKDLTMIGGDITVYDSVKKTKLFAFRNDDGHADHAANIDFEAGVIGRGTITLYSTSCPENVAVNSCDPSFSVDVFKNVVAGSTFTVTGEVVQSPTRTPKLTIDNLGVSGANKYVINQDQSIDAFGINNFTTKSGGRHARYIATGADESDKYLTANIQYFANIANGDTFVVYLPDNPNSGDEVNIIDVGGNLTYNTSLVVRAQGTGTRVQGDAEGTSLGIEGTTTWGSGELVVQTPNAAFTLVYLGGTDSDNNVVGGSVTGWWLKEV